MTIDFISLHAFAFSFFAVFIVSPPSRRCFQLSPGLLSPAAAAQIFLRVSLFSDAPIPGFLRFAFISLFWRFEIADFHLSIFFIDSFRRRYSFFRQLLFFLFALGQFLRLLLFLFSVYDATFSLRHFDIFDYDYFISFFISFHYASFSVIFHTISFFAITPFSHQPRRFAVFALLHFIISPLSFRFLSIFFSSTGWYRFLYFFFFDFDITIAAFSFLHYASSIDIDYYFAISAFLSPFSLFTTFDRGWL